jgi:gliding motility-associated-like protein
MSCVTVVTNNETFDLSAQSSIILGNQPVTDYTLQYYTSATDAQSGINAIANLSSFNPTTNPQTIYARVHYNALPNCYEITTFDLLVGQTPQLNLNASYLGCDDQPVVVNAAGNNPATTTYLWSDGSTGSTISITQPGVTHLTVTATNTYGANQVCSITKEIDVIISEPPTIDHIDTVDWTEQENSITIIAANPEQFEYSLDHSTYQAQNVFQYLEPGVYTVFIRDKYGCGEISKEIWLLNYPKFFTPNGDGYHDLWFIENSENEPDLRVEIFDRYGKLLKVLTSKDAGWDGMYNGTEIFSDDYWFVVHRQDGRTLKGHFAMKR